MWRLKENVTFPFVILINLIFGDIFSPYSPLLFLIVGLEEFPIDLLFRHFFVIFIFYVWKLKENIIFPFVILINIIFGDISSLNNPLFLFIVGFEGFPIVLFFRHFFVLFIFYYVFLHNYFLFFINI